MARTVPAPTVSGLPLHRAIIKLESCTVFNSYLLPGTVGMIAFNDLGRVWMPGESSAQWHDSYGAGLYILPAQLIMLQFAMGFSKEGRLPYISIGYRF